MGKEGERKRDRDRTYTLASKKGEVVLGTVMSLCIIGLFAV